MVLKSFKRLSDKKKVGLLLMGMLIILVGGYTLVGAQRHTTDQSRVMMYKDNQASQDTNDFNREGRKTFGSKLEGKFGDSKSVMPPQNSGEQAQSNLNQPSQENGQVVPSDYNSRQLQPRSESVNKKGKRSSTIDQSIFDRNNE